MFFKDSHFFFQGFWSILIILKIEFIELTNENVSWRPYLLKNALFDEIILYKR